MDSEFIEEGERVTANWQPIETAPKDGDTIIILYEHHTASDEVVPIVCLATWEYCEGEEDEGKTYEGWVIYAEFGAEIERERLVASEETVLRFWAPADLPAGMQMPDD